MRKLEFEDLELRHPIDPHQLRGYANAAKVRLAVHHAPPVDFHIQSMSATETCSIQWSPPDALLVRSYNNADDAKRDGAYVLAFAALEEFEGLVGIGRAETKSGADYYVAPASSPLEDFESAWRLEVSGTDGDHNEVRKRLKQKKLQALKGDADGPAIAAVVGFKSRIIMVEQAANVVA